MTGCSVYALSDETLCATHHGRFAPGDPFRCDRADTPKGDAARDRLAEELHDILCGTTGHYVVGVDDRPVCDVHADRLLAAGFGDTAALTAEVERLASQRTRLAVALNRLVGSVTLVEAEDGYGETTEFWVASPDALEWARAALAGTHDQERGA